MTRDARFTIDDAGVRRPLRIVEIGDKPFIKSAFDAETTWFSTWAVAPATDPGAGIFDLSPATLRTLLGLLKDPAISLIVCQPTFFAPWSPRFVIKSLFSRRILQGHFPLFRAIGPQLLRFGTSAPVVALDQDDFPLVNRNNFFLLRRARLFFKRELPLDRWRIFLKTGHANLPTGRYRQQVATTKLIEKLRPISLGLPMDHPADAPHDLPKTTDVFFAGRIEGSSWLRRAGMADLEDLRRTGIRVDIPDRALPRAEFLRRCAAARLVWSPEGYGWDCFRHYEALACGSVPVCNYPSIERHAPLVDGKHAIFYSGERGSLAGAIRSALADPAKLQAMAAEGRAHVMRHHTATALARYVVATSLAESGLRVIEPGNA